MHGKVAWVTGGATGIGRETARAPALEGAHVVISGRREVELGLTVQELTAHGLKVSALPLDVSDAAAVGDASRQIEDTLGTVSVLVCSAGKNMPKRFWNDLALDGYRQIVGVNLHGVVYCVHTVLQGMRAQRDVLIVIMSSWAGREFLPIAGMAYGGSKTVLSPLTESIPTSRKAGTAYAPRCSCLANLRRR